ncbi:MAG: hypothetical protein M0Q53_06055 [Prolixibacteraceae bacterium]|jgi:hypothetical protein|nr:hypothetical protein [Prolixibacteraceae bacterium]
MKNNLILYLLVAIGFLLGSCNLSDFNLDKFTDPSGLSPVVYRPISSGSYLVKDYATIKELGNTPVLADSIVFKNIQYPLNGMSFNTSGSDSMVVIVKTINETPMKYSYKLIFHGPGFDDSTMVNSKLKSKYLASGILNPQGDVIDASRDSLEFKLDSQSVLKLANSTQIDLAISLYQPDTGSALANVLKNATISFYIGFRAPINLFKLKI